MFNKTLLVLVCVLIVFSLCLAQEESGMEEKQMMSEEQTMAEEPMMAELTVDQMVFCTGVEDREPVGADTAFADTVGQVYCFTKISGAEDETTVSHVWYLNGEEKASVDLSVKGKTWRTWSSKRIPKEWNGTWKVEVKSAEGNVLRSKEFVVQ
jgi:hypothetical protein